MANWIKQVTDTINEFEPGNSYQVLQVQPDRTKEDYYHFAGGEPLVLAQASVFLALEEYLDKRLGVAGADLNGFIRKFEDCFPGESLQYSGYRDRSKPWGISEVKERPQIVRIDPEKEVKRGYILLEFFPEGKREKSFLIAAFSEAEAIAEISRFWNTWQMLGEYDIGSWFGYPVPQFLRQHPVEGISIKLILRGKPEPPFRHSPEREVNIPLVRRGQLNYQNLRQICGGNNGLSYGEWTARAYLGYGEDFKKLAQIVAFGNSESSARENCKGFVGLSELPLRRGPLPTRLDRKSQGAERLRVYPAALVVVRSDLVKLDDLRYSGRPVLSGKLVKRKGRLPLWQKQEPKDWKPKLEELLKRSPN